MYKNHIKRIVDIVCSGAALFVLSPVYLVLYILVRVKLGAPVFFTQPRPGLHGKIFNIYKFRTMTDARDEQGNLLPDEVRLTDFGKILRSTSLDELPEIWNIFIGDMSIVGPRPLLVEYLPYYTEEESRRHDVRPGLTGLAQVNGRNNLNWDNRLSLDVYYVRNMSFCNDVLIILKTVRKVFRREDVVDAGSFVMKDLDIERGKFI